MKLTELAKDLHISTDSIKKFIQDFDLQIEDCLAPGYEVRLVFKKFADEHSEFLVKYEKDLTKEKTPEQIAKTIHKPVDRVTEALSSHQENLFDNGMYRSSVSSYGIDRLLGGDYQFVYNYFGKKSSLEKHNFIGYRDLYFHIADALEPFINEDQKKEWGICKPAGIILYGPPGSGKIFWANKIAEIIGYQFREVKKHYFGTSFVSGKKTGFNDFLLQMMKEDKVLLLMENFDEIMMPRSQEHSVSPINEETKEIILHYIGKFEQENLLMVGAADTVVDIDEEILAPGRFDVMIPIFPPNKQERSEMILHYMNYGLSDDATLKKILVKNSADKLPFWEEISGKMKVFSNTMLIDFTQSLKKKIRSVYQRNQSEDIKIDTALLEAAYRDASAKLTGEYLDQVAQFITDVSRNNSLDFLQRTEALRKELDSYKIVELPRKTIGFTHNEPKK